MRLGTMVLLFLSYSIFVSMVAAETNPDAVNFPELQLKEFEFGELTDCDGIVGCTKFIGEAVAIGARGIVAIVTNVLILMFFVVQVVALVTAISVTGFNGAPPWFNAIIATVFGVSIGLAVYRMIRKGDA